MVETLTGTVAYRQRVALPPGSVVRVRVEDVSRQDVEADVVAETEIVTAGEQAPIPFAIALDRSALAPGRTYALRASIESHGTLRFATASASPLPHELGAPVELLVEAVRSAVAESPLAGTTWALVELDGEPVDTGEHERAPYLVLDTDAGGVSGWGGCNRLSGPFELGGERLRFGPLITTLMACPEPVMQLEAAFLRGLGRVASHRLEDGTLVLLGEDGEALARLVPRRAADGVT